MDLSKFTQKSQEAVAEAQAVAIRLGHQQVDADHLFRALVGQENGLVPRLLERAGYDVRALALALDQELGKMPRVSGPGAQPGQIYVTQRMNEVMLAAQDLAKKMQDE